jgi:hypothetical protein
LGTVLKVTEVPDLPIYSTAAGLRMSEAGTVGGHGAVYRAVPRTPAGLRPDLGVLRQSRMAGNRTISRIEWCPVISITRRSIPMPIPPAGGMPCSSASTNASS